MGHPVPYDFTPFLDAREHSPADAVLTAWVGDEDAAWLGDMAALVRGLLRMAADFAERTENLPRLAGKGPFDNDPQHVVLPAETWDALAAVHGSGIWSPERSERARYAAVYLLNQNGEGGVACSVACTDGLLRVLRAHPSAHGDPVVETLEEATPDDWVHGAQFVTEIQGGSDAATNAVEARRQPDGSYALHGQKWFCSNLTADHWLVTARSPEGIGLFLVDRDQDGYTVERLKDKLGTRALPTAEIFFRGARGRPVGPLDGGLKTMVAEVLVTSRIHNVLAAAAFTRRAAHEARCYARFREAFGQPVEATPLIAATLDDLDAAADRASAGAFRLVDVWLHPQGEWGAAWARIAISIGKAVATRQATGRIHAAMMVMGGNGIEERFTVLPRLWRDSAILETWEGPYSLMMTQALQDLGRLGVPGHEAAFLQAGVGDDALAPRLAHVLETRDALAWRDLAHDIWAAHEEHALQTITGHLE